jgi:hypothetical protein
MGQFLHGSAKTTHAVRAELQRSKTPAAELARRFEINKGFDLTHKDKSIRNDVVY